MRNILQKYKCDLNWFFGLFTLILLQYSWFGCTYWLQLDDYTHYRALAEGTNAVQLCIENGLFTSRPLVGLLDLIFWARIPLYLGTVFLSAIYAGATVLFLRLFRSIFGTGAVFAVVFALLPLGFEGAYWQAAATRILPPMLFTALALTCLDAFVRNRKPWHLAAFLLFSLLSYCFYEQMLVLSLALSLMLLCVYLLQKQWHALWGLSVFSAVGVYAAVTGYFSGLAEGQLASRMKLVLPWDPAWLTSHLPRLMPQLKECFLNAPGKILTKGVVRGMEIIFSQGVWLAVLIPAAAVGVYFLLHRYPAAERKRLRHLVPLFAVLAIIAPITPFFVIADPWVCLRSVVPSFVGLALLVDYLLRMLLKDRTALVVSLLTAVFLTCSVSELSDYRSVTTENRRVAEAILAADAEYDLSGQVGILDLDRLYTQEQNFLYHDHVMSAHASNWALTSLVRYHAGTPTIPYAVVPLHLEGAQSRCVWSSVQDFTGAYPFVFLYEQESNTLVRLTVTQDGDECWKFHDENGNLRATIRREDKYGIIDLIG